MNRIKFLGIRNFGLNTWKYTYLASKNTLKNIIGISLDTLIVKAEKNKTSFYRSPKEIEKIKPFLFNFLKKIENKLDYLKKIRTEFDQSIKTKSTEKFIEKYSILYSYLIISYYLGNFYSKNITQEQIKVLEKIRKTTEGVMNELDNFLNDKQKQFIFYNGKLIDLTWEEFLKKYSLIEENDKITNDRLLKGESINKNSKLIQGTVKIIFNEQDLEKIEEEDIIVTNSIQPNFVPAIKKSKAIITDEGGILCHAAIIARELGKPCIVGTKIATKVLKDNDLVEINLEKGTVKKLN